MINSPDLWLAHFPFPRPDQHKYDRGHVVVSGGNTDCTGAACLAANAALRVGAGLVTVAAPLKALPIYATKLTSVMAKPFRNISEFKKLISDPRKNVILLGPGNGVTSLTAKKVKAALAAKKICVLDADALTVFASHRSSPKLAERRGAKKLFDQIKSTVVLTPHEGEFQKLFHSDSRAVDSHLADSREERAHWAAQTSGAIVVLKGPQTVIAAPDGRVAVNDNAPATLATAGTGDVLGGLIAGLLAQGMEGFLAACCGVWLHGQAAELGGLGLISEDLSGLLPAVLKSLKSALPQ